MLPPSSWPFCVSRLVLLSESRCEVSSRGSQPRLEQDLDSTQRTKDAHRSCPVVAI